MILNCRQDRGKEFNILLLLSEFWIFALQYTPGKYEISRRENRCILKIKNCAVDDAAEFTCEVEGDKTSCKVTVGGKYNFSTS